MKENNKKVLSFPSRVPAKADYQRVKASYSVREIKQLFGLSERTIRRWTEQGVIQASAPSDTRDFTYDFQALTQFRRVRDLRSQGQTIRQIEAELQGQLNLFRAAEGRLALFADESRTGGLIPLHQLSVASAQPKPPYCRRGGRGPQCPPEKSD